MNSIQNQNSNSNQENASVCILVNIFCVDDVSFGQTLSSLEHLNKIIEQNQDITLHICLTGYCPNDAHWDRIHLYLVHYGVHIQAHLLTMVHRDQNIGRAYNMNRCLTYLKRKFKSQTETMYIFCMDSNCMIRQVHFMSLVSEYRMASEMWGPIGCILPTHLSSIHGNARYDAFNDESTSSHGTLAFYHDDEGGITCQKDNSCMTSSWIDTLYYFPDISGPLSSCWFSSLATLQKIPLMNKGPCGADQEEWKRRLRSRNYHVIQSRMFMIHQSPTDSDSTPYMHWKRKTRWMTSHSHSLDLEETQYLIHRANRFWFPHCTCSLY